MHSDGPPYFHHLIPGKYLILLLDLQAFHLLPQNKDSYNSDGVLPDACISSPHRGQLERSLNVPDDVLISNAQALNKDRERRYIMSWTYDPWRDKYSDKGTRYELMASKLQLEKIMGYEMKNEAYFPPKKQIDALDGAMCDAELKETVYCAEDTSLSVVSNPSATARKALDLHWEKEFRIEATAPENHVRQELLRWPITSFGGLVIKRPSVCDKTDLGEISTLAENLGIRMV
jgi:hypothetical protein